MSLLLSVGSTLAMKFLPAWQEIYHQDKGPSSFLALCLGGKSFCFILVPAGSG